MWPVIYALGTRFSRYLVLPVAAVIGTIGYYAERKFMPKQKRIDYLEESVQVQRERRQAADGLVRPDHGLPNSLGVLQPRSDS